MYGEKLKLELDLGNEDKTYTISEVKAKVKSKTEITNLNSEIKPLEDTIAKSIEVLNKGGRLCVITFHSLEDRAVKQAMNRAKGNCTCPKDIPYCVCGAKELGKVITRKPIVASKEEQMENSRSKSAKLRIFEKI